MVSQRIYHPVDVTVMKDDNGQIIGYVVPAPADATRAEIRAALLAVWLDRARRGVAASPESHCDALADAVMIAIGRAAR